MSYEIFVSHIEEMYPRKKNTSSYNEEYDKTVKWLYNRTDIDFYDLPIRQCTKTGELITEGFVVNQDYMSNGDIEYYAYESDLIERLRETYPDIEDSKELLETSYDEEYHYWTVWDY